MMRAGIRISILEKTREFKVHNCNFLSTKF